MAKKTLESPLDQVHLKVKKGDEVFVISGKDKGTTGKIVKSMPRVNKVVVEGVNIITKHQKARPSQNPQRPRGQQEGGRIQKPAPLDVSKVMLVCPQCNKPTRVGYAFREGDEKPSHRKYRVCKRRECGKAID
jgi:large subunit ribosomal protein L24